MSDKNKSTVKLPSLYLNSKLFHRPCRDDRDTTNIGGHNKGIPDKQYEDLEPDDDSSVSDTKKAIWVLKAKPSKPDMTGKLEGRFKVSVEEMIQQLNKIVTAEYSEWMRWYHYAMVLRGHARNALAEEFEEHAEDELEHLYKISLRVIALGGYPATEMQEIKHLQSTDDILQELIFREQEGIKLYREVLKLCGDNEGTRQIIESNIEAEQDHLDELWRWFKSPDIKKAGAAPQSGDSWAPIPQKRRKREYDNSFYRDAQPGVSGMTTPDLPDRGRDWHGTVPGVPDEPGADGDEDQDRLDRPPMNLVDDKPDAGKVLNEKNDEAKKALAAAPRFSPGPFVPPREKEFLRLKGWSDEEIESGEKLMTPRVRAEFNRWLTSTVRKSIDHIGRLAQ